MIMPSDGWRTQRLYGIRELKWKTYSTYRVKDTRQKTDRRLLLLL